MNLIRKLTELSSLRYLSRQVRIDISRRDIENFGLLALICFMIIIYKVNKSGSF